jgi:hypothetical protein
VTARRDCSTLKDDCSSFNSLNEQLDAVARLKPARGTHTGNSRQISCALQTGQEREPARAHITQTWVALAAAVSGLMSASC